MKNKIAVPREGYFKFKPCFVGAVDFPAGCVAELNRWREHLYRLKLVGMYAEGELKGVGYGNISVRSPGGFVITATRTGSLPVLGPEHYTEIIKVDIARNTVDFRAMTEATVPSSECMTHAMFYQADPAVGAVIHVHHLEFWKRLLNRVPTTARDVEYGTPGMANEILRLYRETDLPRRKLAAMAGHEEGIIAFGCDLDEAGKSLLDAYRIATAD
ncbi:MAG: class II aldolase/adducin family protein [bacterium]